MNCGASEKSPPQQRRGGRDIKKMPQYLIGAAGVVLVKQI
jgi:hypothetical protein